MISNNKKLKDLENIDEIRILNGLDIDEKTFDIIEIINSLRI